MVCRPSTRSESRASRWYDRFVLLSIAWGVFAFGGAYSWAYTPLLFACAALGAAGLLLPRAPDTNLPAADGPNRALSIGLVAVTAAVVLQLIPFDAATLTQISPAAIPLLQQQHFKYATVSPPTHPLSVSPEDTLFALTCIFALAVFMLGCSRYVTGRQTRRLARGVLVIAFIVALVAIVQKGVSRTHIYAFWRPESGALPFGPFVNANHFAGWMLMALPLGAAYLMALLERLPAGAWTGRSRARFVATPAADEILLVAVALLVMAVSLVMTLSRSGLLAFVGTVAIAVWCTARAGTTRARRLVAMSALVTLATVSIGWVGIDVIAGRFADLPKSDYSGRIGIWRDTVQIVRDFPLTGTGLGTYSVAMLSYQTIAPTRHYAWAHNDYLQLAAEGGVLLVAPVALLLALFAREARRRLHAPGDVTCQWIRLGALMGIVAISLQEFVEFSLQLPGNAVFFAFLCAIVVAPGPRASVASRHPGPVIRPAV